MEFGLLGLGGFPGSTNGFPSPSLDHPSKQKETSRTSLDDTIHGECKPTKFAKLNEDLTPIKNFLPSKHSSSSLAFFDGQQELNMLSFSSPKLDYKNPQISAFPYFQLPNSYYNKTSGYSYSCTENVANTYYLNGVRGPFTPSQWLELEQQALIYKYIIANEPIPPNLLIPIRRAFESAGLCTFPGGLLRPNTFGYGWGPFHLGLANNTDPEPGRCRRTDGKKWRCSRDAVPDQKYCERHINRGRHRSRKPVEGQSGHPISGATTNKASNSATTSSTSVVSGAGQSNNFAINFDRSKDLQPTSSLVNRLMVNKEKTGQETGLDLLSPKISLSSTGNTFSVTESTVEDFAFLTSDAIYSTTKTGSSVSRTYAQGSDAQQLSHIFADDHASILWPKLQTQSDKTTADFMSSTSSPTGERNTLSPLRLFRELDSVPMGLSSDTAVSNERSPISWETSMGGPLGEVLKIPTSSSLGEKNKEVPALNLLSKGYGDGSPQLASSPTGVLQRTALGYFSNSSAGSSPRPENGKALESASVCCDLIGFTLASSSCLPS
ncbi:unnamed protein product [Amaranthus hypochondriacus]